MKDKLVREELPIGFKKIARERIAAHLTNQAMVNFNLQELAINCYFQGCLDMTEALNKRQEAKEAPC